MTRLPFTIAALLFATLSLAAAPVDFVRDVRPLLEKHCYSCHGEKKQKSGLRLDIKAAALKGGDEHAPDIVPGKAKESPLVRFVKGEEEDLLMPPKGERLSAAEIATLSAWIDQGASWPDGIDAARLTDRRDHWSFKPVRDPAPPEIRDAQWPRNAIDRFILARLEKEGLSPRPEADRATWLRRIYLDLIGLPPSPQAVDAFVNDRRSDACDRVIDELLQSPRYGERWAQHWLDVVRYADTHGFEVNTPRENAWPYRDYVIRAFNRDTPYDRFIREQIAGDAMGADAATGFLVTAAVLLPGQIGKDDASKRLARQDALGEIVINTGQTFLGLSVGCARCHDHKFDPISQRDYYAMQAFFSGVNYGEHPIHSPEADALRRESAKLKPQLAEIDTKLAMIEPLARNRRERAAVNARMNVDRFAPVKAKSVRFSIDATNGLPACLDELEVFTPDGRNIALASAGAIATSSGTIAGSDRHKLEHLNDGRYGNARSWLSSESGRAWVAIEFPEEQTVERVVWGRDREGKFNDRLPISYRIEVAGARGDWQMVADSTDRRKYVDGGKKAPAFSTDGLDAADAAKAKVLLAEKKRLEEKIASLAAGQTVYGGTFETPEITHLLHRGDPEQPEAEVVPAVLRALDNLTLPEATPEQQRRLALADWIASPKNPLTARVMVNRIWQGHFGTGLVETPSDFGRMGSKPSHPELLDWLATEFVRSGWSIKHLHRLIVNSATYRQASSIDPAAQAKDADDRLLWRFPSRRLEAEAIRDSMLAVSGRLNLKTGGPGFNLFNARGGLSGFPPVDSFSGDGLRRMIYAHKVRMERDAVFGAFDCPDAGQSTATRGQSTTPIQALNLFNSRFTIEEANAFAARVERDTGATAGIAAKIRYAFRLALGREPDAGELDEIAPVVRQHGLATLCRVLFNSSEFLFLP